MEMTGSDVMAADQLSLAQARRIAIRAQGLDRPRPTGKVTKRHLRKVVDQLGLIQLDSVNVLARTQYLTLFARLGPYDPALLDGLAYRDRELFEYWGHVASLVDVRFEPFLRWRMANPHHWNKPNSVANTRPDLIDALEREIHDNGPLSAGELEAERDRPKGPWWDWSHTKTALEYLFWTGRIGAVRRGNFERVYCHPDDAVPPAIRAQPTPVEETAKRHLLHHAVRMHGIGTAKDLADVWRLKVAESKARLDELVAEGAVEKVQVEGWRDPAYLDPTITTPRTVDACALVSPFDSAMWERSRIERLHDFAYTIEIYTPKPKRIHGYYVLPFLLGDTYVGRVDLKADRKGSRLLVQAAHTEPDLEQRGFDEFAVAERLHGELRAMADWLGLTEVHIVGAGDLAPALAATRPATP